MASPTSGGYDKTYGYPCVSPLSSNVASPDAMHRSYGSSSPDSSSTYEGCLSPHSAASTYSWGSATSPSGTNFIGLPTTLGKQPPAVDVEALDIRRRMAAEAKAQKLFQDTVAGRTSHFQTPTSPTTVCTDTGLAIRQQAIRDYKEKKRLAKLAALNGDYKPDLPPPRVLLEAKKERLATTTRKKVVTTADEATDSIQNYKTGLDREREKEATIRALSLLKEIGL
jgi:hypothetical protein